MSRMSGRGPLFLVPLRLEELALRFGAPRAERERIGMGPVRAVAACARHGQSGDARPVVLIGCAGGLDPSLQPGDLVVASSVHEAGQTSSVALPGAHLVAELLTEAVEAAEGAARVHLAPVVSSSQVVSGEEAREAARHAGAVAVDMESLWCAPLARTRPLAVVRSILDVPGKDLRSIHTAKVALRCARSIAAAARALHGWQPDLVHDETLLEAGDH